MTHITQELEIIVS